MELRNSHIWTQDCLVETEQTPKRNTESPSLQ